MCMHMCAVSGCPPMMCISKFSEGTMEVCAMCDIRNTLYSPMLQLVCYVMHNYCSVLKIKVIKQSINSVKDTEAHF